MCMLQAEILYILANIHITLLDLIPEKPARLSGELIIWQLVMDCAIVLYYCA